MPQKFVYSVFVPMHLYYRTNENIMVQKVISLPKMDTSKSRLEPKNLVWPSCVRLDAISKKCGGRLSDLWWVSPFNELKTLEVFVDQYNAWLPVCYTTSWDNSAESKVICGQLGFNITHDPGITVLLVVYIVAIPDAQMF